MERVDLDARNLWVLNTVHPRTWDRPEPDLSALETPAEVRETLRVADRLGVLPTLLALLQKCRSLSSLGEAPRAELDERWHRERLIAAVMDSLREQALQAVASAGIRVAPIGPTALQSRWYPHRALRGTHQVDLWIERRQLNIAIQALGKLGCRVLEGFPTPGQRVVLIRAGEPVRIVIETLLFDRGDARASEQAWARCTERRQSHGSSTWDVSAEDLLAQIILRARSRIFDSPAALNDAYALTEKNKNLNWDALAERLGGLGGASAGWFFGRLARGWAISVPDSFVTSLGRGVSTLRKRMLEPVCKPEAWWTGDRERAIPRFVSASYLLSDRWLPGVQSS